MVVGLGLQTATGADMILFCGGINALAGLFGLTIVISLSERARKAFYDDPRGDERGGWLLFFLIALPIPLFFCGLMLWLLGPLK